MNLPLSLYNTRTKQKEVFSPLDLNLVKMYVCGPTVYDNPHLGNARSVVVYDMLYRVLRHIFGARHVQYVRNITDIDDKIIHRANELKLDIISLTSQTIAGFHHDMLYLNCLAPDIEPKATNHISEMINIIQKLIAVDAAYTIAGNVYFDVNKCPNYTMFSGRSVTDMIHCVRIEHDQYKKHPCDFILWKSLSNTDTEDNDQYSIFDSPWGKGRPGWHIECSAMSYKYCGMNFDIHGGGADLIFPHHTNEIAQSTTAFPGSVFANYWVHNGFLTVNSEKMSKSLGNFITVQDLIKQNIQGDVIRLALLSAQYRKPLDFNNNIVINASKTLNYWYNAASLVNESQLQEVITSVPEKFMRCLLDDLNTPLAFKTVNDYAKSVYLANEPEEKLLNASLLLSCAKFIGLMNISSHTWFKSNVDHQRINDLIAKRTAAKKNRQWSLADDIRKELHNEGIAIEDQSDGSTIWYKNII